MSVSTKINYEELLSDRIKKLSESATLAMNQKSRELKSKGINVINLSIGEPDFYVSDEIKKAAKKAVDDNYSFYPPVAGYDELREAIVEKLKRDYNLNYKKEQIVVSNGAKHSIMNAIYCLVNHGDEVIIPTPYWLSYPEMVKLAGGIPVFIETNIDSDFKMTPEQLERAITPKTKLLIYSSPSNPTGSVYTKDELKGFASVLRKHKNIMVISDEIYELINFTNEHISLANFPEVQDQVVLINGVSKAYAMPGYRIGFMAAPEWLANAAIKLQGQMTSSASSIAQMAAVAAFREGRKSAEEMCKIFLHRRDLILSKLKEIPYLRTNIPQGAFYVLADASYYIGLTDGTYTIKDDNTLCLYLLDRAHVALIGGSAFGAKNYIRFSYATSDENIVEGVRRIKEALNKLY